MAMVASIEWFAYNPPNSAVLNDDNGDFAISIHNEDLVTHPRKTYLELRGKVSLTSEDGKTAITSIDTGNMKVVTCGWLHLFDRIDFYLGDNKIDTVRRPGIVSLMKGLVSFQTDKMYCDAGWNLDVTAGENTLKSNGWFHAMIPMTMVLGFNEDHKSFVYNMPQKVVFYRAPSSVNNIFQLTGDYEKCKVKLDLRHVTLNVPHIKFDLEHTTKVRNEISRNCKYEMKYHRWFYSSIIPPTGEDFTWDIPVSYSKMKYVLIAFQTNRSNVIKVDGSQFDLCDLENCQVLLNNNVYYPLEPLNLNVSEHRCGALYNMYKRFKASYYSKDDDRQQPLLSYNDFLTKFPIIAIDCSHQPTILKESLINMKIFFSWRKPLPANTTVHCVTIVDDKAIYSPLTSNVFHG